MALVKYNNNSISAVTSASSIPSGALTHIKTLTASSSATLSFVDGSNGVVLDSTYPIYKFEFINIHPSTDINRFQVNFRDGGSLYDAIKTTTNFATYHNEAGTTSSLGYNAGQDLAQSTSSQLLSPALGSDNDQSLCGDLILFNPSSTTFVKHFLAKTNITQKDDFTEQTFTSGYCNVTVAIDGVQFSMNGGNIDSGTIKLYGIKDS